MKHLNIFKANKGLEVHTDTRGVIADIFFNADIHHAALVRSEPGAIRGNHYHKISIQHMLIVRGSLEYWFRELGDQGIGEMFLAEYGDLIRSDSNEIHALRIGSEGCDFIAFSTGLRGGSDYELDTFRVDSIIGE